MNYKGTTRKTLKIAASASLISVGLMGAGAGTALAQESPSTPGVTQPGKAKTPAQTAAPKTEQPSTPGTDQPSTPGGGTDQPSTPGTDQPSTPGGGTDQPGTPGGGTDQPGTPTEPTKPTQPTTPTEPTTPTQPTQPTTPTEPTEPTTPTEPTQPTTPTEPTKPVQPTQPTQPVKPVTPVNQAPVDNIKYTLDVNGAKFGAPVTDATPQGNLGGYSAQFQVKDSGNYLNIGLPGQKPQTITWSHDQAKQWEDSAYQLAGPFEAQVRQFVKDFQRDHGGAIADWAQGVTNGGVKVTTPAPAPAAKPAPKVEAAPVQPPAPAAQQVSAPVQPTPVAKPAPVAKQETAPAPTAEPVRAIAPLAKQVGVKVDFDKLPGAKPAHKK